MSKPRKKAKDTAAEVTETLAETMAEPIPEPIADSPSAEEETEPDPMEVLRTERDSFQEKWLRAVAEMENVRKRARRDVQDSRRFAQADLLRPLLDVYDNFERALQSLAKEEGTGEDTAGDAGIREGIDLIFQKFRSVLKEKGVQPISALETEFDPKVHEAVGQLPREGVAAGIVIEVVQPGFLLGGDFVLRPARVIIAG
ncbi:MAG: nucleotide exchange factor GrpE [Gemmatimonadales bacterium]|nr:nucleotide exchange factor GrpE [Gemmatimonadales bacterium]